MQEIKKVSVLGCGWYGFSLATTLISKGYVVKGSTTSEDKLPILSTANINPYLVNFSTDEDIYDPRFFKCDILFISIPPKIRAGNGEEYLIKIQRIIDAIKHHSVKQIIFISSTGVYGDVNAEVNELSNPQPDSTSGQALLQAEHLLKQQNEFTTTIIRFAGLIGPGRDPGRFLAGKKDIPNGNAPVNLIHLTDCVGISCAILTKKTFGYTFNACSTSHPTRAEFYSKAAILLELDAPQFIMEKKSRKVVSSIHVDTVLNYKYEVDNLMDWLDKK